MSRPARVIFGAVLAVAQLVGCSLLVDTSGLAGGGETSDGSDGSPRFDARPIDDGRVAEGGPSDARVDAPAGDAAPKCVDGANRFCDDFDEANPGAKWTSSDKQRGALTFDSPGLSPPHALNATISAGAGNGSAALYEDFAGVPGNIRCAFDLKVADVPTSGEIDVVEIVTATTAATHQVYLERFGGTWSLAEFQENPDGGAAIDRSTALGALPTGTWFNVVLDVTPITATLTANGRTVTLNALSTPAGTKRTAGLGITYADTAVATASLFIDNVDCTTAP